MKDLSINRICNNTYTSFQSKSKELAHGLKFYLPPLIGALFFKYLSHKVLTLPSDNVAQYVSQTFELGTWGMTALSAFALYKGNEQYHNNLSSKKIEYIRIPKQEFEAIQSEVLFLRQQLGQTTLNR